MYIHMYRLDVYYHDPVYDLGKGAPIPVDYCAVSTMTAQLYIAKTLYYLTTFYFNYHHLYPNTAHHQGQGRRMWTDCG